MRVGNKRPPQIHQPLLSPDAMAERWHGSRGQWRKQNAQPDYAQDVRADFRSEFKRY